MRTRWIFIGLISVAILALLAYWIVPRLLESRQAASPDYFPTQGWLTSTPEEQGLDSAKLAEGLQAIQAQGTQIDSVAVIRDGRVLLDAYYSPYDGAYLHDLASVTKSFMTTLIGIAIDQGKLQLDQPVLSFFRERTIANVDARKESMTVEHLVSMRNGFASGCQTGDLATIGAMTSQPDWIQAALDRPMAAEPGTQYCYDSPGMHLLSAILQKATGMTALEFARQNLFEPLGIQDVYWKSDPQGVNYGGGDLHLKPLDAAKVGYLWLSRGAWDGKQIVSADWVADSIKFHSEFGGGDGYGYGWWLWDSGYGAEGRQGQSIKVEPAMDVIVVTTGTGFDYDTEIDRHLVGAVVDLEEPLPPNPEGVASLTATLSKLAQKPAPQPVAAQPEMAKTISGRTYVFPANQANIETLQLDFSDSAQAVMHVKFFGSDEVLSSPIGLDGVYRPGDEGDLRRGHWADPETFILEIHDLEDQLVEVHFEADQARIEVPGLGISFAGQFE